MYRMENVPGSSGALLDSNHSHFLLVDNGTEGKYGVEIDLRSRFEEAVMKVKTDSRSAAGTVEQVQAQRLGLKELCHENYQNLRWEMPANMSETRI